jgi:PadR family transcriptional regulator PadR
MNTLTPKEFEILRLLTTRGEMYGLQMVDASDALKPGTIYVTLSRMAEKGYVTSRAVPSGREGGLPRRLFSATGLGERAYRATAAAGVAFRKAFAW